MKEVLVRTKPYDSSTLAVSDSSASITFNPPLYLQANRNYELAMVNLETYYSFANIREDDNNSFKWRQWWQDLDNSPRAYRML